MQITQRLNNNFVLVESSKGSQMIVMGKGVGYKAYPGNLINESLIERKYILKNDSQSQIEQVAALISEIPMKYIVLSDRIIKLAEEEFQTEFGLNMMISLTDHIFSAIQRKKNNIDVVSPLHWDIKQLYTSEYTLGRKAVEIINDTLNVKLPESEATAIAMHFISSGYKYDSVQQAMNIMKIISDIITIIQYHFQIKIDQDSINFSRLVSHLQYFLIRQVKGIKMMSMSEEMIQIVINQYQSSFQCAEKIVHYLNDNHNVSPSLEEEVYLSMHIERVRQNEM